MKQSVVVDGRLERSPLTTHTDWRLIGVAFAGLRPGETPRITYTLAPIRRRWFWAWLFCLFACSHTAALPMVDADSTPSCSEPVPVLPPCTCGNFRCVGDGGIEIHDTCGPRCDGGVQ